MVNHGDGDGDGKEGKEGEGERGGGEGVGRVGVGGERMLCQCRENRVNGWCGNKNIKHESMKCVIHTFWG
jgi:hypothetical protein